MLYRSYITSCFLILFTLILRGQDAINHVGFDNKILDNTIYSFFIGGHLYGQIGNSVYPSSSLLANLDSIKKSKPLFFISLGDNYRQIDSQNVLNFKASFLDKCSFPVFNAVGNHDLTPNQVTKYHEQDYTAYNKYFGRTYYSFSVQKELYIILDTEKNYPQLEIIQLEWLKNLIDSFSSNNNLKNVFIFSHKRIWENDKSNFKVDILPILKKVNSSKAIYWCSGDYIEADSSLYYVQDLNLFFIATSLKDDSKDKILRVFVDNGNVNIVPFSLTHKLNQSFNAFKLDSFPEKKLQSTKEKIAQRFYLLIKSRYFYIGLFAGTVFWVCLYFYYYRKK